jgi:hypothetical protein
MNRTSSTISGLIGILLLAFFVGVVIQMGIEHAKPPTPIPTYIPYTEAHRPEEFLSVDDDAEYGCTDGIGAFYGNARNNGVNSVTHVYATVQIFDNKGRLITSDSNHVTEYGRAQLSPSDTDLYGRPEGAGYFFSIENLSDPGCRGVTYKVTFEAEWMSYK